MVNEQLLAHITKSITDGDKMNKTTVENFGKKYGVTDQTEVKETAELAVVLMARKLAHSGKPVYDKYEDIVDLYDKQVSLNHRTSQSMLLQQYSTPAPVGYLMGVFCGIDKFNVNQSGFEPSAGNGLLTIAGNPKQFDVNDIDDTRYSNLKYQGYRTTTKDNAEKITVSKKYDAVLTNPPFGKLENTEFVADKYKIKGLEHYMAIVALNAMKDDGRAAIIVGGHLEFNENGLIPSGKNRIFFAYLYKYYHVADVINIDGSLYKKQGTSFNVRVILISGRKVTPEGLPPFSTDIDTTPITDFDTLYNRFEKSFVFIADKDIKPVVKKEPEMKKEFTFYSDSPMKKGKALPILDKLIRADGKVMTFAAWIESFPHDLKIDTEVKMHSNKSEKGYTFKKAIGDHLVNSLAEIDYYKYLEAGGYPYTEFKKDEIEAKKIADDIKREQRRVDDIASAQKRVEANTNRLVYLLTHGLDTIIETNLSRSFMVLKSLEEKRKTESNLEDIERTKANIEGAKKDIANQFKNVNEVYHIVDGIPAKKFSYTIGENVLFKYRDNYVEATIDTIRENTPMDPTGEPSYKMVTKAHVDNWFGQQNDTNTPVWIGYESVRPADFFNKNTTEQSNEQMSKEKRMKLLKLKANALLLLDNGLGALGMAYESASQSCNSLNVDTPDSMGNEIKTALNQFMKDVGDVDTYVADKLKFSHLELCKYLAAEQVDAVALAIYNIEKNNQGIIIADQTGIGKGRQAAAIIRYAILSGVTPIFMTEKPNLFSDIYRDLEAIGSQHFKPFIMNGKESKTLVKDAEGNVVYEPLDKPEQDKIIKSGKLPKGFDYIMLTYSQISGGEFNKAGVWVKESPKQSFLLSVAQDNILILDESHNASGASNTGKVLQKIVSLTRGVTFLSATFAKRPDNMPLYAMKTAMQEANMSSDDLVAAIEKGGVALQEVLSAQLVSSGQLIRRERTFEGIEVNYITLLEKSIEHKAVYDNITKLMRDIIWFQSEFIDPEIEELNKIAQAEYGEIEGRKGGSQLGVDSTPYFSKVFNQINQMLFAIKADSVADRAIMRLQQGKKPVIAFSSTMGSFLASMEDNDGLPVHDGSMINADFNYTLHKALIGVLRYTEKDEAGTSTYKTFDIAQFSTEAQMVYNKIASDIKKLTSGLYISPIDVIKEKIEAAGYRVGEVTGRSLAVQYVPSKNGGGMKAMVMKRKKENVTDAFRKFNNNELDVLLINQSGATGASAHAVTTPLVGKDEVKQRVMIVLQAELDINTEVQKRGRINRTGQILKPIYDYLISDIPAEKRLMMMLQKKLKSLDANTTSNQKNSEALLKSDDFLNKYGDKIVTEYLKENPDLNKQLDDPLKLEESQSDAEKGPNVMENAASKVSGRVAVLTTKEQEQFYVEILERYNDYITELQQKGLYDLEVELQNLQAETLSKDIYKAGKGGKTSFGSNTYIEQCEVNIIKKPYTAIEVNNLVTKALDGRDYKELVKKQSSEVDAYFAEKINSEMNEINESYDNLIVQIVNEPKYKKLNTDSEREFYHSERSAILNDTRQKKLEKNQEVLTYKNESITKFIKAFEVGALLAYPNDNENQTSAKTLAVSLGIKINYEQKNPFAPSAIKLNLAVSSVLKYVTIPLSKNIELNAIIGETGSDAGQNWTTKDRIDELWQARIKESSVDRGKQFIITGNVLQAFGDEKLTGGKLVQYTTIEGTQRKGIVLPIHWTYGENGENIVPLIPIYKARKAIRAISSGAMIHSGAGQGMGVSMTKTGYGDFKIFLPKSRKSGGDIYLDRNVLEYIEDNNFNSIGVNMVGIVSDSNLYPLLEILQNTHNVSVRLQPWQMDLIKDELEDDNYSDTVIGAEPLPVEIIENERDAPQASTDFEESMQQDEEDEFEQQVELDSDEHEEIERGITITPVYDNNPQPGTVYLRKEEVISSVMPKTISITKKESDNPNFIWVMDDKSGDTFRIAKENLEKNYITIAESNGEIETVEVERGPQADWNVKILYTTAPATYDDYGTKELEVTEYKTSIGTPVRKVSILNDEYVEQLNRYIQGYFDVKNESSFEREKDVHYKKDTSPAVDPDKARRLKLLKLKANALLLLDLDSLDGLGKTKLKSLFPDDNVW